MKGRSRAGSAVRSRAATERGLALVMVLWVLVLLSLVAASFMATTRTEVNLIRNLIENAKAAALADAGVYRAVLALLELENQDQQTLSPEMEELLKRRPELERVLIPYSEDLLRRVVEGPWRADGTPRALSFGGGWIWVSIQDEGGKIDLNAAPDELLRGLFLAAQWSGPDGEFHSMDESEADALVDAVRDFTDEDDLTRLNGAEDRDYAAAGLPWDAKDGPFEAVEELQQVIGMSPDLYARVAPALTVYSGKHAVDPRTAPREVLLALPGVGVDEVEALLAARAEAGERLLPPLAAVEDYLTRSKQVVFMVRAEAHSAASAVFVREAVVRLTGDPEKPFVFHVWKQGRRFGLSDAGGAEPESD